jgi:N-acetylmuramoyl-L-alanine amidase
LPVPETARAPEPAAAPLRPANRPIQVVILDPGHGGADAGCQGPGGTKESAIDLAVALKTQKALQAADSGIKVILTREKDPGLPRHERAVLAESNKGDLLVSLHCGASLAPTASGFEIFCCNPVPPSGPGQAAPGRPGDAYAARSLDIAGAVAETLAGQTGSKNRGVWSMPCAVLSETRMCGLLIEVGCLTSPAEEMLLQTDAYQDKIAQGVAAGIAKFLSAERQGKGAP